MKTLGKIKLNQFSGAELERRKMNALRGGCTCTSNCKCGCGCGCIEYLLGTNTLTNQNGENLSSSMKHDFAVILSQTGDYNHY